MRKHLYQKGEFMRTREFIDKVKNLGFVVKTEINGKGKPVVIRIGDEVDDFVVIWANTTYALSTIEYGFTEFWDHLPLGKLYKLCFEYAATPVKDREEDKKFFLEHKYLRSVRGNMLYFTIYISHDLLLVKSRIVSENLKQKFTLKKLKRLKKNTILI